jgi:RNA-binding protein YlmH
MDVKIQPVIGYVQRPTDYKCPVTGQWVSSNRQRANIMREHNLIDANDFPLTPAVIEKEERKLKDRATLSAKLKDPLLFHD